LTFGELTQRAQSFAVYLRKNEPPGTRVLLLLESGLSFIEAFFGCMFAGLVPIPVDLPRVKRPVNRLDFIVHHSLALAFITSNQELPRIAGLIEAIPSLADLRCHRIDMLQEKTAGHRSLCPAPNSVAFIQYTSGSTNTPKGVIVTHENLFRNQQQIQSAFGHDEHTIFAGWLPMFHDMGLVGNILQPLFLGVECTLMPPSAFVQRPSRWLRMISKYRATTSGGPNFAFDHCVDRIAEADVESFDLSTWRVAFNGAEPVRERTISNFARKFRSSGFSITSFLPCYGLAEATLFVSGKSRYSEAAPTTLRVSKNELEQGAIVPTDGTDVAQSILLTASGPPADDQIVVLVDPKTARPCPSGHIGEIWIAGPNIAAEYFNGTEIESLPTGKLDTESATFFKTGDLGALWNDELFVVGRIKNLIIIRGRNIHAEDIEQVISHSHDLFQPNRCAAFAIENTDGFGNSEERLVVIQEIARRPRSPEDVQGAIAHARALIVSHADVAPHEIMIVRPGTIPTTSSGKIRHGDTRTAYQQSRIVGMTGSERLSAGTHGEAISNAASADK
jgi:acyl-CoA synthetase (AMP-forming)/AMP-acid ligase II